MIECLPAGRRDGMRLNPGRRENEKIGKREDRKTGRVMSC